MVSLFKSPQTNISNFTKAHIRLWLMFILVSFVPNNTIPFYINFAIINNYVNFFMDILMHFFMSFCVNLKHNNSFYIYNVLVCKLACKWVCAQYKLNRIHIRKKIL